MIQALQIMLGFMTLGWNIYKNIKKQESAKKVRREKCTRLKKGLRKAKHAKDTGELEDFIYELGYTGKPYANKLPTPGESKSLGS
jgi:hypothetical protein